VKAAALARVHAAQQAEGTAAAAELAAEAAAVAETARSGRFSFSEPRQLQLDLDKEHVRQALLSAPRGAAPGGSGMVTDIFRGVVMSGGEAGLDVVTRLLQPVARGTLPQRVADALGASVLLGIAKPGTEDLRPIGVGEGIRRLAARCIVRQFSDRIRAHFEPLQC